MTIEPILSKESNRGFLYVDGLSLHSLRGIFGVLSDVWSVCTI